MFDALSETLLKNERFEESPGKSIFRIQNPYSEPKRSSMIICVAFLVFL